MKFSILLQKATLGQRKDLTRLLLFLCPADLGALWQLNEQYKKNGRENILLWFADVKKENADLYRFVHDVMDRFGGRLYYFTGGRRPEDVWDKRKIVPNNQIAPCFYELKVKPFRNFIQAMNHLPAVYIGYKPGEDERMSSTTASYKEAIPEVTVDYPLLWRS